jgi:hypothetical protein
MGEKGRDRFWTLTPGFGASMVDDDLEAFETLVKRKVIQKRDG